MRIPLSLAALGLAAAAAAPASAALPPNYQRAAELRAVLDHPGVAGALTAPIDRIEFLKDDLYRVTAGACRVDVAIVDLPTARRRRAEALPGEAGAQDLRPLGEGRACRPAASCPPCPAFLRPEGGGRTPCRSRVCCGASKSYCHCGRVATRLRIIVQEESSKCAFGP